MESKTLESKIPQLNISTDTLALHWTRAWRGQTRATKLATDALLVLGGTVLLVLLAQVRIPMAPVPITGQTLGILLIGAALGWQRGLLSVIAYLLMGLAGAPVFVGGIGPAAFFGPTGGYLFSFVPAVVLVGYLAERGWDRNLIGAVATFFLGHVVIFAFGVSWLAVLLGPEAAISGGLVPFIPGMLIKTAIAAALLPLAWSLGGRSEKPSATDQE